MAHGLDVVLEAAKILKTKGRRDIGFCLIGDGASRQRLENQARQSGLDGMVVFAGRQPAEEIPAILASSHACLIHLKDCELFRTVIPSKIFETMAMGRPIIMGVRGEARDIVMKAGAAVEMEPESAESLVRAVERLADDPHFASQLGRSARNYVAKHHNRDMLAARFLRLLQKVAGVGTDEVPTTAPETVDLHPQRTGLPEEYANRHMSAEKR